MIELREKDMTVQRRTLRRPNTHPPEKSNSEIGHAFLNKPRLVPPLERRCGAWNDTNVRYVNLALPATSVLVLNVALISREAKCRKAFL